MKPKEKGGLGVLNLRLQNDALLMKHLSKFYNKADIPGCIGFGINTTPPKYHILLENRVPSSGRMCSDSTSFLEVLSGVN